MMPNLHQYHAAQALEQHLGDAGDETCVFSLRRAVELDEADAYPEEACAELNRYGLNHYYVPRAEGGKLESFEEFLALVRVVAQRDFTVGWAHGMNSVLGAVNIWVGGDARQKQKLAHILKQGGQVAVGYHEKSHGSDLLAVELEATKVPDGYLLSGEKWVIGNAARGAAMTVFARTDAGGGARGFSLFFVEKKGLDAASYSYLPRVKTHGIRGADISGIRFDKCLIADTALVGETGRGLELTMRSFQITRTLFSALSLGAADRALRTAASFALSRKLYGGGVFDIPHARKLLCDAFLDLLACDCVAVGAARALHVVPEQMSVRSAVVKFFVPATIEKLILSLSVVIGARYYLREDLCEGIFQKLLRDSAAVGMGHSGSFTNLLLIAQHLRGFAAQMNKRDHAQDADLRDKLNVAFSLHTALPAFSTGRLEISSRGQDDALHGVETALETLSERSERRGVESEVVETITRLAKILRDEILTLARKQGEPPYKSGAACDPSPEAFELAETYCTLHAAAACLQMWLHNAEGLGEFFSQGRWLALCLHRLLSNVRRMEFQMPPSYVGHVAREIAALHAADKLFSIVPIQLAGASSEAGGREVKGSSAR